MEFSFRTRETNLQTLASEVFDFLVVGGGITGVSVARDAATRGLKVGLIEKGDLAQGTSSKSSKLIHGGLRYLENFEFKLVYEALHERRFLLKSVPHLVRPLPFMVPVYRGDPHPPWKLSLGLTLYDLLSLFHAPQTHSRLSGAALLKKIPFLKSEGLLAGFRYFDASMWDDVLTVELARASHRSGVSLATRVEANAPLLQGDRIAGVGARDLESGRQFEIKAHQVVVCAGPWADQIGKRLDASWKPWLGPSQGAHLVFDQSRVPVEDSIVMSHPKDGRISFVIPRADFGQGVVIVGTTDGQSPENPDDVSVKKEEVEYLLALLGQYFPGLGLGAKDIVGQYVGVRPLMGSHGASLQKASREHHIGRGPKGTVFVVGGKYTTHRVMAREIVDVALRVWREDAKLKQVKEVPKVGKSQTHLDPNPIASKGVILDRGWRSRYGGELSQVLELRRSSDSCEDPAFPELAAQIRFSVRNEMALHLEDIFERRTPIHLCRRDRGSSLIDGALQVLAEERGWGHAQVEQERQRFSSKYPRG